LLSAIYEAQGDAVTACNTAKRYEEIKDSVISDQFKGQLYSFKQKETESKQSAALESLKDKRTAKRIIAVIAWRPYWFSSFLPCAIKTKSCGFKQRAAVLEMKALRRKNEPALYLQLPERHQPFYFKQRNGPGFGIPYPLFGLMRMVLVNAGKTTISLEEELNMLKLYLNMEQLRFKDAFDYFIYCDPKYSRLW